MVISSPPSGSSVGGGTTCGGGSGGLGSASACKRSRVTTRASAHKMTLRPNAFNTACKTRQGRVVIHNQLSLLASFQIAPPDPCSSQQLLLWGAIVLLSRREKLVLEYATTRASCRSTYLAPTTEAYMCTWNGLSLSGTASTGAFISACFNMLNLESTSWGTRSKEREERACCHNLQPGG